MAEATYIDKAYDEMLKEAQKAGFTETQLLFIMTQIIKCVSPSLQNLQEQIDELKGESR